MHPQQKNKTMRKYLRSEYRLCLHRLLSRHSYS